MDCREIFRKVEGSNILLRAKEKRTQNKTRCFLPEGGGDGGRAANVSPPATVPSTSKYRPRPPHRFWGH